MPRRPLHDVNRELDNALVERFVRGVFKVADLPTAREPDVRQAAEFWATEDGSTLGLTCSITGSTYERQWDGSDQAAAELADKAAEGTAYLVTKTPHYAWLRSAR